MPEEIGGTGGDFRDAFHILRLVGKYAVPLPVSETLIVQWLLAEHGESTVDEVLTFSINSRNKLELEETGNGFSVNGSAKNVPWARHAKKVLVLGIVKGESVIALLPIDKAIIRTNTNLAGEPMDTVIFDNIYMEGIPSYVVDEYKLNEKISNIGGLVKAVMMSGAIEKVLELSLQYATERQQFGRPLHRLQAIQQHLAILAGETVAASTITNQAIEAYEQGVFEYEIATAKMRVNEASGKVTEISHQLHGAIGVTHEHRLHQMTRRLWVWREQFGNESFWADKLAFQVMNSNSKSFWEMITDKGFGCSIKEELR